MDMLNHLSHVLRQPLEQISGPLAQLQNSDASLTESERRQLYRIIGLHTSRLLHLVDRLQDTAPSVVPTRPEPESQEAGPQIEQPDEQGRLNNLLTPTGRRRSSHDIELLNRLFRIIEDNLEQPDFNVHKMCGMVHLSHMHFIRKVKQLTGKKPVDLLKSHRLKRAKELLRQHHLTVAEIAYKVGYGIPNSFSRAFKREFGISPSAYPGAAALSDAF